jgi:PAS domain S-box-containing protein
VEGVTVLRAFDGTERRVLRILHLEDNPLDAELVQAQLSEGGIACELVRVQERADFAAALEEGGFDLILADYALPGFDGLSAMEMARKIRPEPPFILISGTLGEEVAIETLKKGATDYVLKHRLQRLVPAVRRAMHEAEEHSERERAEEALRRSEQRLRTLVEQIPATTYTQQIVEPGSSRSDPTLYASPQIEAQSGYPPQAFVEDPELWISLLHPEDRERVLAEDRHTDETGESFRIEFRQIARDGRVRWIRDEAVLVRDEEGRPRFWQGVMFDITEQKRAEQALRESEQQLRAIFDNALDAIVLSDDNRRYVDANRAACELFGVTKDVLLQSKIEDFSPPGTENEIGSMWQAFLERGRLEGEFLLYRPDGTVRYTDFSAKAGVLPGRHLTLLRDITDRKRVQEDLEDQKILLETILNQAADALVVCDAQGRYTFVNAAARRLALIDPEEITLEIAPEVWGEAYYPGGSRMTLEEWSTALALRGETTLGRETRMVRPDGSHYDILISAAPLRNREGTIVGAVASFLDITERKQAEEALQQSEELYRTVVEQAAENIFIIDPDTKQILEANAALHHSLGYTPEQLKSITLYDIVAHDRESIDNNIRRILAQKRYFIGERKYRRKDGSLVSVEVNVSTVPYGGKEALCTVAHDVTERKQAEQELRRSLSILLALREANEVLGSTLKSEEIVTRLLEIMRGVAALTAAVISRIDEKGELHVWRSVGLEALWPQVRFTPEARKARWRALEHEEQYLLRLRHPDFADRSLVALYAPLRVKDRVVGVLEGYGSEALAQSDTVEVLSSLTNQAASALEKALLYEELGARERALQDLIGKLLGAQEEERRRVAYEVHDGLAQVAAAAHQHLQAFARRYSPDAERGQRDLERIVRLVRATVSDARRIIANLRPTTLDDLGLAATISLEVERLGGEGYQVDYEEDLGDKRLPNAVEIALFRVAQEALTNVRKHARTRRVRIVLRRWEQGVRLEVRDQGQGFDPAAQPLESGPGERVGLVGMRERVGMLGGGLEIDSRVGAGTAVVATVPLTHAAQSQ